MLLTSRQKPVSSKPPGVKLAPHEPRPPERDPLLSRQIVEIVPSLALRCHVTRLLLARPLIPFLEMEGGYAPPQADMPAVSYSPSSPRHLRSRAIWPCAGRRPRATTTKHSMKTRAQPLTRGALLPKMTTEELPPLPLRTGQNPLLCKSGHEMLLREAVAASCCFVIRPQRAAKEHPMGSTAGRSGSAPASKVAYGR